MSSSIAKPPAAQNVEAPWWRHPMVWLVIGGPAIVVVAAIATAVIAIRNADPVMTAPAASAQAERPAMQARNQGAAPAVKP